ncbi:serine/threonine-protein kinase [Microbispora sp. NPDC049125]|uniref:serine/threonine-protein kinase n=1 Tax=Microbispora sp. NPDC049125 TaxID=3154929 RepID=UPI0034673299
MEPTGAEPLRPTDPPAVGPYRLLGRLGEGGMGTVYLAVAPAGRLVAVKVVKAQFNLDEDFAARFHAEVSNARRVASFCTAQVLDNGDAADGTPYMVTEYISGTPLSQQISRYGPLEPGPLHGVALGVAAALAAIHVAGLVHRDLKPANVILSITGPRVIDFGIARALDATHGFTQSGELLGSPGWWAPEQVRGEEVTPATDVFAWGCLVAYAGTGRPPFGRGDVVTLAARVLNDRPDLGALPAPLGELTRRATDRDPRRRPSAQELLISLVSGVVPVTSSPAVSPAVAATEMLSRSWEPPANVAAEQSSTRVLDGPAEAETVTDDVTVPPEQMNRAYAPRERAPVDGIATAPPGRRGGGRLLMAAAAVVAALAVTAAVLVSVTGRDEPLGARARTAASPVTAGTPTPGGDVGRHIRVAGYDTQLLVPRPPRCGLRSYGEATAPAATLCVIGWSAVNLGGNDALLVPAGPRLVDDRGGEHAAESHSTSPPAALPPGGRADGVLIFDLPPGRRPARLVFADGVEVRL